MSGQQTPDDPTRQTPSERSPEGPAGRNSGRSWPKLLLRWSPLILLVFGGIAIAAFGLGEYLTLSAIVESRSDLLDYVRERPVTTMAIYLAVYVVAVVFSVPGGSFLTVVGGILFGGLVGGLATTVAATFGSVCVYYVAKSALGDWMRRRMITMGPRIANITEGFRTNAFYVIVVLRLVPVMPYWASNAVPALFGVGVWVFIAATLLGLLPWTVSFAFFGAALDEIVEAQEIANPGCADVGTCELDFSAVSSGPIVIGVVVAIVSLIPVGVHWWRRRRQGADETGDEV